jgi:hypothetical protein
MIEPIAEDLPTLGLGFEHKPLGQRQVEQPVGDGLIFFPGSSVIRLHAGTGPAILGLVS